MALGLGHTYWVKVIKSKYGSLEECMEFMKNNPASNNYEFYELHQDLRFDKNRKAYCVGYRCDLVIGDK